MSAEIIPFPRLKTPSAAADFYPCTGDRVQLPDGRSGLVIGHMLETDRETQVGVNTLDGRGIAIFPLSALRP